MSLLALNSQAPVARKSHTCDYCGQAIPKDQKYKRWVSVDEGVSASTVRAHVSCDDIARDFYEAVKAEDWWVSLDPLQEWAGYSEDPEADLADMAERWGWAEGEVARLMGRLGLEGMK